MKKCSKCGCEGESKFCPNCGTELVEFTDTKDVSEENNEVIKATAQYNNEANQSDKPKAEGITSKTWFVVLFLIIFWPVGVFLMWKKKKFNKVVRIIISAIIGVLLIVSFTGLGDTDTSTSEGTSEGSEITETVVQEETTETTEETKSEADTVYEMGQTWFQMVDWNSVFKYKADVHYIMDYTCNEVTGDDLKKYGDYVAIAGADLQNGFGAEFESRVYIFMDKSGIAKHVFYDEADGTSTEIPMDSIPML